MEYQIEVELLIRRLRTIAYTPSIAQSKRTEKELAFELLQYWDSVRPSKKGK